MERMLLAAGSESGAAVAGESHRLDAARLVALNRVVGQIESLATTTSRMPQFPRRFTAAVMTALSGSPVV